jgi:hypothetical protein
LKADLARLSARNDDKSAKIAKNCPKSANGGNVVAKVCEGSLKAKPEFEECFPEVPDFPQGGARTARC